MKAPHASSPQFGRYSWRTMEAEVARNAVLNRPVIDTFGYTAWAIAFSRTGYERLERFLDWAMWIVIGMTLPILVQKPLSNLYTKKVLQKKFSLDTAKKPLSVGFELLDKNFLKSTAKRKEVAEMLGVKDMSQLDDVVHATLVGKAGIILSDLFFLASKGLLFFWGKNWLTEKLSREKGFSGTMAIANDEQKSKMADEYEQNKKRRQNLSMLIAAGSVMALPSLVFGLLKSKGLQAGKGLKRIIPFFNYHDTVYMSKFVLLWHTFFNWNVLGALSARSSDERREHISKSIVLDSLWFLGDDIFAGLAGLAFAKGLGSKLKDIKLTKPGLFGIPIGRKLDHVYQDALKTGDDKVIQLADKVARWNFRISILSTAAVLGISTTLINNFYTRKKLLAEQRQLRYEHEAGLYKRPLHHKHTIETFGKHTY